MLNFVSSTTPTSFLQRAFVWAVGGFAIVIALIALANEDNFELIWLGEACLVLPIFLVPLLARNRRGVFAALCVFEGLLFSFWGLFFPPAWLAALMMFTAALPIGCPEPT